MTTRVLTRRAALTAVGAIALAPMAALAQAPLKFRAVKVDVGPLRAERRGSDRRLGRAIAGARARPIARALSRSGRPQRRDAHRPHRQRLSRTERRRTEPVGPWPGYDRGRPHRSRPARASFRTFRSGRSPLIGPMRPTRSCGSSGTATASMRWRGPSPAGRRGSSGCDPVTEGAPSLAAR